MTRNLLFWGLGISILFTPLNSQGASTLFSLDSSTDFNNCKKLLYDGGTSTHWSWYSYYERAQCQNSYVTSYDEWLLTPECQINSGDLIEVSVKPCAYGSTDTTTVEVLYGQGETLSDYQPLGRYENLKYASGAYYISPSVSQFAVRENGKYRVAVRALGPTSLYMFTVKNLGTSTIPGAVNDLTALPAGNSVTLSFALPTESISYSPLDTEGLLTYTILRDDHEINSGTGLPGAQVEFEDIEVAEGEHTYKVSIADAAGVSGTSASIVTFIGAETPNAVANPLLTAQGQTYTLTWDAPTVGVHGAILNHSELRYKVTRILDDVASEPVETEPGATTFTETFEPQGLQNLKYEIRATLDGLESEAVVSNSVTIGALNIPFSNSFAGDTFATMWVNEPVSPDSQGKEYSWEQKSSCTNPSASAQDDDGAFAYFNSYNARSGASARLSSMPISLDSAGSSTPGLEFWMHHMTTGNDVLKVQVSCDGGEWTDVTDAYFTVKDTETAWKKHVVGLGSALTDCTSSFRIGFLAISAYGKNTVIDNVSVVRMLNKDIKVASVTSPESVVSGNTMNIEITIANGGADPIAADDYEIEVITDFDGDYEIEGNVDLAPYTESTVTVSVPVHAMHALAADGYTWQVRLNLEGDEDESNNLSEEKAMSIGWSSGPSVPAASVSSTDNVVTVTWDPANDPTHTPYAIDESFEDYDKGATGNVGGFTIVDRDSKAASSAVSGISGSKFNVCQQFGGIPKDLDGSKFLGVTCTGWQQDDWIISPKLEIPEGCTADFSCLIGFKKLTNNNSYYFTLYYTESETFDASNPANTFKTALINKTYISTMGNTSTSTHVLANDAMHEITASIPQNAKYVALFFNSTTSSDGAIFIDKIHIGEKSELPLLGYHVYEHGVSRTNESMLATDVFAFDIPTASAEVPAEVRARDANPNTRNFYVTAVYPDGEAEPSPFAELTLPTGIENIEADDLLHAEWYSPDGICHGNHRPGAGLYITRFPNGKTAKVIIK